MTLSENGSVPYPDEMKADGANWSWFMPWYGDYAMAGWANDNDEASWKKVMSDEYTLTLEDMPGWKEYTLAVSPSKAKSLPASLYLQNKTQQVNVSAAAQVRIFDVQGNCVLQKSVSSSEANISLSGLASGNHIVRVQNGNRPQAFQITLH